MSVTTVDTLYHYTTASSLYSMLSSKQIWLTDYRFLNDRKEFLLAAEIYKKAFALLDRNRWTGQLQESPELQRQLAEQFAIFEKGWFGPSFDTSPGYLYYVFSLSKDGDSLAQWRAYGNGEVCVGFRKQALENIGSMHQSWLREVSYASEDDLEKQRSEISNELDNYVAALLSGNSRVSAYLRDKPILDCAFIKHKGFETENEWRLVQMQPPQDYEVSRHFRTSGRYLVPCMKVGIDPSKVISKIIFGPEADQQIVQSLRDLVRTSSWAFLPQCEITQSKIPYRT